MPLCVHLVDLLRMRFERVPVPEVDGDTTGRRAEARPRTSEQGVAGSCNGQSKRNTMPFPEQRTSF